MSAGAARRGALFRKFLESESLPCRGKPPLSVEVLHCSVLQSESRTPSLERGPDKLSQKQLELVRLFSARPAESRIFLYRKSRSSCHRASLCNSSCTRQVPLWCYWVIGFYLSTRLGHAPRGCDSGDRKPRETAELARPTCPPVRTRGPARCSCPLSLARVHLGAARFLQAESARGEMGILANGTEIA